MRKLILFANNMPLRPTDLAHQDLLSDLGHFYVSALQIASGAPREAILERDDGMEKITNIYYDYLTEIVLGAEKTFRRPSVRHFLNSNSDAGEHARTFVKIFEEITQLRSDLALGVQNEDLEPDKRRLMLNKMALKLEKAVAQLGDVDMETIASVFICHSTADKHFVRKLAKDLTIEGVKLWVDEWEMLPGDSLYKKIQNGISDCDWFVIVLTPNSVDSRWCQRELHAALERELDEDDVVVVPLLYKDCNIPHFLREKVWADARGQKYRTALTQLRSRFAS